MEKDIIYLKSSENMENIPDKSIDLIVTSPPYNIDIKYGNTTKGGKAVKSKAKKYTDNLPEEEYRAMLGNVFNECKRVLKDNGSIWVNIKNRYSDNSIITPFWLEGYFKEMYLKNLIVWNFDWGGSTNKRFAPRYEFVFWYTKSKNNYIFNLDDVKIPALNYRPDRYKSQMKNPSDVWKIPMISGNFLERTGHPAQYPEKLVERIVLAGTNENDIVMDPFMGSGTTAVVAKKLNRHYIGFEVVPEYIDMANIRVANIKENCDD
jgi:DNA modification methylase